MDPFTISSVPQATAYFTGYTNDEQKKAIVSIQPESFTNRHLDSLNITEARSFTGEEKEFRQEDFIKAYRQYNGFIHYPFHSVAEITNHVFDPSYFDGSESAPENFNVQENLIGTPLGATELHDPRLVYIDSLLKLKGYQAGNRPLDDSYIKQLYMLQNEKSANYYTNQLSNLKDSLGNYSRTGAQLKNGEGIHPIHFERHGGQGTLEHKKEGKKTISREMQLMSATPLVQSNHRRDMMNMAEKVYSIGNRKETKKRTREDFTTYETGKGLFMPMREQSTIRTGLTILGASLLGAGLQAGLGLGAESDNIVLKGKEFLNL